MLQESFDQKEESQNQINSNQIGVNGEKLLHEKELINKKHCPICNHEMLEEEEKYQTECNHTYHFQCFIDNLSKGNRPCMICDFYRNYYHP